MSDAASRYLLRVQAVKRADADHVWPILDAAFREYGLPRFFRSDNGAPFASVGAGGLSPLAVKLVQAGVAPERIRPGRPQENGRHERMHLTLARDCADPPARSLRAQGLAFEAFRKLYNETRPHEALNQTPPAEHYAPSPRRWSGRLRPPEYPPEIDVRKVKPSGEIKWRGRSVYVSQTLAGQPIGLEQTGEDRWRVAYGPVELGSLGPKGGLERPQRSRPGALRTEQTQTSGEWRNV